MTRLLRSEVRVSQCLGTRALQFLVMVNSLWGTASLWDTGNNQWDGMDQVQLVNIIQATSEEKN